MEVRIGNHTLGPGYPTFIVAEMSANHGGTLERALEIVRSAKRAGADAVKLQTYTPDTITLKCNRETFKFLDLPPGAIIRRYGTCMTKPSHPGIGIPKSLKRPESWSWRCFLAHLMSQRLIF